MATLCSNSSGNFTASGTWSLVDSTSFLDSETNSTNSPGSYTSSSAFTPGIITIDGIGIKVNATAAAPSGLIYVQLYNSTLSAAVAGTEVSVNATDLPQYSGSPALVTWVFFKFAASVTLLAATNYTVQVKSPSQTGAWTILRDGTANNWSRFLRTTTTQAPAAADKLIVCGAYTAAATYSSYTVTMDNTSSTVFGPIDIATRGTLDYGTSASTNYNLIVAGDVKVSVNGTLQIGTSSSRIPSTSTATLQLNCASAGQYQLACRSGGTIKTGGSTDNLTYIQTKIAADVSASATSLTTADTTGWKSGNEVVLSHTTRSTTPATLVELRSLNADASGTTLTWASGLTNARLGTAPRQAHVFNITRNVTIKGGSAANTMYMPCAGAASLTLDLSYTTLQWMGTDLSTKPGLYLGNSSGSTSVTFCVFRDNSIAAAAAINVFTATLASTTVTDNIFYAVNTAISCQVNSGSGDFSRNYIVGCGGASVNTIFRLLGNPAYKLDNMIITGNTAALAINNIFYINDSSGRRTQDISGMDYYCNSMGPTFRNAEGTFSNIRLWRNANWGFLFSTGGGSIFSNCTLFGNAGSNITFSTVNEAIVNYTFNDCTFDSDATYTTTQGINAVVPMSNITFNGCSFGTTSAHTTADINMTTTATVYAQLYSINLNNCTLASSTEVLSNSSMLFGSYIASQKHDATAGNHKGWGPYGTWNIDTTIYDVYSPSERRTPNNANKKLESSKRRIPVRSGKAVKVSVRVRKSSVGDGTAYNGNQLRLILKRDDANGTTVDTVCATGSAATGTWETLTYTTSASTDDTAFTFLVDGDGTTGWYNVDNWNVQEV